MIFAIVLLLILFALVGGFAVHPALFALIALAFVIVLLHDRGGVP